MAPSGTSSTGIVSVPKPPITFNGVNYREFVQHMRIHLRGQRLWVYLTGERPCPPHPVPPTKPIFPADATEDVQRAAVAAFEDALEEYQTQLHAYEVWNDGDAKASAIVVASIELEHASDMLGLSTAKEMWDRLRAHYEPKSEALYISALRG